MKKYGPEYIGWLCAAASAAVLFTALPAYAAGWTREGSRYKWYNAKGQAASEVWIKGEDGRERWLDDTGFMVTESWVRTDKGLYYVDEDGARLTSTWAELNPPEQIKGSGDLGTFEYYFTSLGRMADDRCVDTGGSRYYVGKDGRKQFGWIKDGVYYADRDGAIVTGWQELTGPDGKEHEYYFAENGKKTRAFGEETFKIREIDGSEYCFDADGILQTGWVDLNSGQDEEDEDWRYYDEDGAAASGKVLFVLPDGSQESFYFRENGAGFTGVRDGKLYYMGKNQTAPSASGYRVVSVPQKEHENYVNYLVDTKGNVVKKDKVRSRNGVRYETDAGGRVRTVNGRSADGKKYAAPEEPERTMGGDLS